MVKFNLSYLLYLNILLFVSLIILLLYLVIQKQFENKRNIRKDTLKAYIGQSLRSYLLEDTPFCTKVLQRQPIFFEVLEESLEEHGELLNDEESHNKIKQLAIHYLSEYYQKRLAHNRWSIRMNTLYQIEDFKLESFEQELIEGLYVYRSFNSEKFQLYRTLAALQSPFIFQSLISNELSLPKTIYKELLRRLNDDTTKKIINHYYNLQQNLQLAILEYIGEKKMLDYLDLVEKQLQHSNFEIRLSSLKVLSSFGYITDPQSILPFLNSSIWQERMLAAKLCGILKKERYKPCLVQLISDENWYVRNAAGEALQNYADGIYILEHIVKSHKDAYAKDMAKQWLESDGF